MKEYCFLIIHGLGGSGPDHWQSWLADKLIQRGHHVVFPTFSNMNHPNKEVWLQELSSTIEKIPDHQQLIVITHSLGGILWQHFAAGYHKKIANHVIVVAPPSPAVVIPSAKSFFPVPLNRSNLTRVADETLFIHSTNDPYCSMEDVKHYLQLNLQTITLPNMGHINVQSGHGKWQLILELCDRIVQRKVEDVI